MRRIALGLVLMVSVLYAIPFAHNNVMQFYPALLTNDACLRDYENLQFGTRYITPLSLSNSWLQSENIFIDNRYQIDTVFAHFDKTDPDSFVVVKLRDGNSDVTIDQKLLTNTGEMRLKDIFNANITVSVHLYGGGIKLYSYGLTRKKKETLRAEEVAFNPSILFFGEDVLKIIFTLKYPAVMDIIIFDTRGKIITYLYKNASFREGYNCLLWDPVKDGGIKLVSGDYLLYFRVRPQGLPAFEISKEFLFVNR